MPSVSSSLRGGLSAACHAPALCAVGSTERSRPRACRCSVRPASPPLAQRRWGSLLWVGVCSPPPAHCSACLACATSPRAAPGVPPSRPFSRSLALPALHASAHRPTTPPAAFLAIAALCSVRHGPSLLQRPARRADAPSSSWPSWPMRRADLLSLWPPPAESLVRTRSPSTRSPCSGSIRVACAGRGVASARHT